MPVTMKTKFVNAKGMQMSAVQAQDHFQELPEEIRLGTMKGLHAAVLVLEREVVENLSGTILKRRTGKLAQSVRTFVRESVGEGGVGSPLVYAPIHEYGGVIRPVKAKWLTIPIGELKDKRNVLPITEYKGLKFAFGKGGGIAYLGEHTPDEGGGRGTFERPMFALVKKVTIPARKPFRKARISKTPEIIKVFNLHAKKQLEKEGYS